MTIIRSEPLEVHRVDHDEIVRLIPEGARVLDLGCGDGTLLLRLIRERKARGEGVEIDEEAILQCVSKGLSVYHGNLDDGLQIYPDKAFDYVILNQTLQVLHHPRMVLREMLRVGKHAVVSFPNFAHWRLRWQLFFLGIMPKSKSLPFEWYDTPNIHLCTIKDFYWLCEVEGVRIETIRPLGSPFAGVWPNLTARSGIFVVSRPG